MICYTYFKGLNFKPWLNRLCAGVGQVVLATNIAETSLTIEDVVYVVDTGKLKVRETICARRRCCRTALACAQNGSYGNDTLCRLRQYVAHKLTLVLGPPGDLLSHFTVCCTAHGVGSSRACTSWRHRGTAPPPVCSTPLCLCHLTRKLNPKTHEGALIMAGAALRRQPGHEPAGGGLGRPRERAAAQGARRARPPRALLRAVHARALRGAHAQVPGEYGDI